MDIKHKNAKKRFELRYAVENEYHSRNQEKIDRNQERVKNRTQEKKFEDEFEKGIIYKKILILISII